MQGTVLDPTAVNKTDTSSSPQETYTVVREKRECNKLI